MTFTTGTGSTCAKVYTWIFGSGEVDFYVDNVVVKEFSKTEEDDNSNPLNKWNFEHNDIASLGTASASDSDGYNAAGDVTVVPNDNFSILIPNGTAIQNARTSYAVDNINRDGLHLSFDFGRYIAALTYVKMITGKSIDNITYAPEGLSAAEKQIAIESVNNAIANPFAITQSVYTQKP